MKYSTIALKVVAARECGIIKSNNQFWKEFSEKQNFEEAISENNDIKTMFKKLSDEFDLFDDESGIVCAFDDDFPVINQKVNNNSEKPYLLFYRGNLSLLGDLNKNVAVIGLVEPDEETKKRESKIVQELASNELIIVSGLALGCDTVAHEVCLKGCGKTIAILPSQINKIFPAKNRDLAVDIVKKNGLLLSEYYKDAMSRSESINRFIERDRLQAMFAKAVILIASFRHKEGDSGSRHAMTAAQKYGIERYVMYNPKTDENNKQFGLNRDLVDSKDKVKVKILMPKSIKEIIELNNPDFTKNRKDDYVQQTLENVMFSI